MIDSSTAIIFITLATSGVCILSLYSVYGNVIKHETTLHDLRNRVEELQNQQALRLAELKGEIAPTVEESVLLPEELQSAMKSHISPQQQTQQVAQPEATGSLDIATAQESSESVNSATNAA